MDGYDVVACQKCGFAFADNIPSQRELDEYYTSLSKYEQSPESLRISETEKQRFLDIALVITEWCPDKTIRILDIGCANGELLATLKSMGYQNLEGLDPSPACAKTASELYSLSVLTGTISDLPKLVNHPYDLVIMIGVLEHIEDLSFSLGCVKEVLAQDGKLLIEVPDATDFLKYIDAPYQQFSTEHINFFSQISLDNLLIAQGFESINHLRTSRKVSAKSVMPVVMSLFKINVDLNSAIIYDNASIERLQAYITASAKIEEEVRMQLKILASVGEPILVWGTGTHTMHLIARGLLDSLNIVGFVDSNPKYQGMQVMKKPVYSPVQIQERKETILISTIGYQEEIEAQIREELKMSNQLIKLYQ